MVICGVLRNFIKGIVVFVFCVVGILKIIDKIVLDVYKELVRWFGFVLVIFLSKCLGFFGLVILFY